MTDQHTDEFPSDAPEHHTVRKTMRPFGADAAHALRTKQQALATLSRQECFDRGYLSVKDLDDEELRYGRCRDENGYIPTSGKKTQLLPIEKYDEMVAEHEMRFKQKLRQNLDDMLGIMVDIAKDDTVEPRDRFEAAKYLFERTAGKTPETVNVNVKTAPYEELLGTVTGIGAISRAEHRRLNQEGPGSGIIDVEFTDIDQDPVPSEGVPFSGQSATRETVVQVHSARPGGQEPEYEPPETGGEEPHVREYVNGEPTFRKDPADDAAALRKPTVDVVPAPHEQYGSRRTEAKGYAAQAREAEALAQRRREAKERIRNATKQRKIARATGADAITDEITGATLDEEGKLTFE